MPAGACRGRVIRLEILDSEVSRSSQHRTPAVGELLGMFLVVHNVHVGSACAPSSVMAGPNANAIIRYSKCDDSVTTGD